MQYSNVILVLTGKNAVVYQCVKYVNKLIKLDDKFIWSITSFQADFLKNFGSKYMHQNKVIN